MSPGELSANNFLNHFASQIHPGDRVIDFGCGTGRVARNFLAKGLHITLVDLCPNCLDPEIELLLSLFPERISFIETCLWNLPKEIEIADWVYCCDVLEHIPEKKIDFVLKSINSRNSKGGYFSIGLKEDVFGKTINSSLHLCLQSKDWWDKKISSYWHIESSLADEEEKHFHCCVSLP